MSIDRCADCGCIVDTDDHPDAYIERGNMRAMTETVCVCERCQEIECERRERNDALAAQGVDSFTRGHSK